MFPSRFVRRRRHSLRRRPTPGGRNVAVDVPVPVGRPSPAAERRSFDRSLMVTRARADDLADGPCPVSSRGARCGSLFSSPWSAGGRPSVETQPGGGRHHGRPDRRRRRLPGGRPVLRRRRRINGPTNGGVDEAGCGPGVKGYDCMSLVQYAVYQATGIALPGDGSQPKGVGTVIAPRGPSPRTRRPAARRRRLLGRERHRRVRPLGHLRGQRRGVGRHRRQPTGPDRTPWPT